MIGIQRMIGLCAQHDVLFEAMSGEQHFHFWGMFKGVPTAHGNLARVVESLLEETQLTKKRHLPVSAYSGGMRRRVSLGNAVVGDAPVLFLDEPTTGMDVVVRRIVWRMVQRRKEDGAVVVLTTHSMEEADMLGTSRPTLAHTHTRGIEAHVLLSHGPHLAHS